MKTKINETLSKLEKKVQKDPYKIVSILLGALLVIFIINLIFISSSGSILKEKAGVIKEANKPIKIELSLIDCNGCSNISSVIESIKNKNVDVLNEESFDYLSNQAKDLIEKYGIKKLPSVLIFGEIDSDKVSFDSFKLNDDALVLDDVSAPYFDLLTNEIKGKVEIIEIVDSSCDKCISLSSIPLGLAEAGVFMSDWKKIEYGSEEGKKLVSEFGIKHIPTLLISKDIDYYETIKQSLAQLDLEEKQGFYTIHSILPPYRDLTKNKVVGLVDLIMLKDNSCSNCYDVTSNKQILQRLGIVVNNENTYDISSAKGKDLISKYNIEKVPIIILSPEADVYDLFVSAWEQVGSEESDGWFVMRKPEGLGTIKDIVSNKVIER